jgi:hypothetical protein
MPVSHISRKRAEFPTLKMPDMLGWLYDQFDKPWKNERRRLDFDKLNARPFVKMLREYQPDIIVCSQLMNVED